MIHILTIIGARPQIIKAAALSRAIRENFSDSIHETIVHTGQHYDHNMSDIFISELGIPNPDYNLGVGSGTHGSQTASMIEGLEKILLSEHPDWCIVFGDTNSTLAGAVAAAKTGIPIAHIEAGLRSFDKTMPEELNRVACDHFSTLLFVPTDTGVRNLIKEGFSNKTIPPYTINNPAVIHCGDIMYDNTVFFKELALQNSNILTRLQLKNNGFALCTIHRNNNTDNTQRLVQIFDAIADLSEETGMQFIIPLHPRTSKVLHNLPSSSFSEKLKNARKVTIIEPVSFLEMTALEANASIILTDSGGVQKEAYFMRKPCVILRNETEWTEIIEHKAGILADADSGKIKQGVKYFLSNPPKHFPPLFGNGKSAIQICQNLVDFCITENSKK